MPFVSNVNIYWNKAILDALLGTLTAVPGAALLDTPTVHLYQTPHTPNPSTDTPASFEEAVFDGYAADAVTLGATVVNSGSNGRERYGQVDFVQTGVATGTPSIYGFYLTNGAGSTLYAQGAFVTPIPMTAAGNFISMDMAALLSFLQSQ